MTVKMTWTHGVRLAVLLAATMSVHDTAAQSVWGPSPPQTPTADEAIEEPPAAIVLDFPEPDWTLLDSEVTPSGRLVPRNGRVLSAPGTAAAWTSQDKGDGSSAMSVKQSLSPIWDTRIGADINVARPTGTTTTSDMLRQKFGTEAQPFESGGTAWAAMTAPGVGSIWDKTAIEARVDPAQDLGKFGTSLSKSVPLNGNQYSLTLQNGMNVVQQNAIPSIGYNGRPTRTYETDQSAKLSIADTGTSFSAGQSLSTTDDKWLRKVGAEQKLFGGVNISASVSETLQGPSNRSLTAGFKHSW